MGLTAHSRARKMTATVADAIVRCVSNRRYVRLGMKEAMRMSYVIHKVILVQVCGLGSPLAFGRSVNLGCRAAAEKEPPSR
jgi:hypothetical protein